MSSRSSLMFLSVNGTARSYGGVPRLELRRILEEADDLPVLRVSGHAVPGARRQARRGLHDDRVHPLGDGAVGVGDLRDPCEHDLLAFCVLQRIFHGGPLLWSQLSAHRLPFVRSMTYPSANTRRAPKHPARARPKLGHKHCPLRARMGIGHGEGWAVAFPR